MDQIMDKYHGQTRSNGAFFFDYCWSNSAYFYLTITNRVENADVMATVDMRMAPLNVNSEAAIQHKLNKKF